MLSVVGTAPNLDAVGKQAQTALHRIQVKLAVSYLVHQLVKLPDTFPPVTLRHWDTAIALAPTLR